ncbi:MAG: DMT family transporter [Myxococcota bacterium]
MKWLLVFAAVACGLILPLQPGINAHLRTYLDSPISAAFVSFFVGSAVLAVLTALVAWPSSTTIARALEAPWWAWTGGLIGATVVSLSVVLAPRLGATLLVGAIVTGQLIGSLVIDHFGLVGFAVVPISPVRALGVVLLVAGVVTVQFAR